MKFLLFAGMQYYPCGGWRDFVGVYETLPEAMSALAKAKETKGDDWSQIVELETLEVMEEYEAWEKLRGAKRTGKWRP